MMRKETQRPSRSIPGSMTGRGFGPGLGYMTPDLQAADGVHLSQSGKRIGEVRQVHFNSFK